MAREINLLRRTRLRKYGCCLTVLEAFAERAPTWQRGCLFFYAGLGTWLAPRFGVDMNGMWSRAETILADARAVTSLDTLGLAELLARFAELRVRKQDPLRFEEAKEHCYDHVFWPLAAHMAFALQPSAVERLNFILQVADSLHQEHARIADLGCGPGMILSDVLLRNPNWSGDGLDISRAVTEYASKLAAQKGVGDRAHFSTGDIVSLPYRDACFDLVIVSEVLEHVPAIETSLSEIARVLRPGGKLAVSVPIVSRTALHVHSLQGGEDVAALCRQVGLITRHIETRLLPGFGDDWRHAFLVAESLGVDRSLPALAIKLAASQWRDSLGVGEDLKSW